MITIPKNRINKIFNNLGSKRILVVGDIMIDEYLWGKVNRLSPEAPVPVVDVKNESLRFGGAANVALNLKTLGCIPIIIGIVGKDQMANSFLELMKKYGMNTEGIVTDEQRPTTVKTRIIGDNQHIARVDREKIKYADGDMAQALKNRISTLLESSDAVILQDYNKGVLSKDIIQMTLIQAAHQDKISAVDPKFMNFLEYRNATIFKPNIKETAQALARAINTEDEIKTAGKMLLDKLNTKNVLLTLGSRGMALFESNGSYSHVEARTREVADVSGAGDTVISTMTAAMAGGAEPREAATISNYAAGIVCGEVGIVPIEAKKLIKELTAVA
ncbi:MAG: D-glycero-beta-D-manno-heptose-7-phosphate kinase [Calditrichaceae bacterium]